MKKLYSFLILTFFVSALNAQSFPYLNASSGNPGDFPVDKDTNIYMFHGNRLVKTDKDLNVIWAKTYSNLPFTNLLLSKTGCIYFLAGTGGGTSYFGKMSLNGTIDWIKNTNSAVCNSMYMDRQNNLVLTGLAGSSFLLKTDTMGNLLKIKFFQQGPTGTTRLDNLTFVGDSAGVYKLFGAGQYLSGHVLGLHSYSDSLDTFTSLKEYYYPSNVYSLSWTVYRSRFSQNFYMTQIASTSTSQIASSRKFGIDGSIKVGSVGSPTPPIGPGQFTGVIQEAQNGDILTTIHTGNSNSYLKSIVQLSDSNGNRKAINWILNNYYNFPYYNMPPHLAHVIHTNKYFFDISGNNFPTNPLTIQKFDSTLAFACSTPTAFAGGPPGTPLMGSTGIVPTVQPTGTISLTNYTTSITSVSFSLNANFCVVLGAENQDGNDQAAMLYPNPAHDIIEIRLGGSHLNAGAQKTEVEKIEVFDVTGRLVNVCNNSSEILVDKLPPGMYYVTIHSNGESYKTKFVKE